MDTLWTIERFEHADKRKTTIRALRKKCHWWLCRNALTQTRAKMPVTTSFIIDTQTQLGLLRMRCVVWSDPHVTGCYVSAFRQQHISRPIQWRWVQFHYQNRTTYENQRRRNRLTSLMNISTARLFYKHYSFRRFRCSFVLCETVTED